MDAFQNADVTRKDAKGGGLPLANEETSFLFERRAIRFPSLVKKFFSFGADWPVRAIGAMKLHGRRQWRFRRGVGAAFQVICSALRDGTMCNFLVRMVRLETAYTTAVERGYGLP